MINSYLRLVTILVFQHRTAIIIAGEEANIDKRIEGLKQKIMDEIQADQMKQPGEVEDNINPNDYYDFIITESSNALITPIIQYQHTPHRHKKHRGILGKGMNITYPSSPIISQHNNETTKASDLYTTHKRNYYNKHKMAPAYRRFYLDEEERNKPQKWTHCLELITPRLKGYKDTWNPTQINSTDGDVRRLAHLLHLNVTDYTKEEIESTLYQISNMRIRLFQWDFTALTSILNVIIQGATHDFRSLKAGVKALFKKWHLDITMLQVFLRQTRIFRPPCIDTSEYGGSTKTTGGVRYTKPTPKKDSDSDCE